MESEKSRLQVVLALLVLSVMLSCCFWLGLGIYEATHEANDNWIPLICVGYAAPIPLGLARAGWNFNDNSPGDWKKFNFAWLIACAVGEFVGFYSLYLIIAKYRPYMKDVQEREDKSRELRRVERKLKEADAGLERVNANIADLEKRKEGLTKRAQALLDRNAKAEMETGQLTAIDPANLGLKVKELRKRSQRHSANQLRDRRTQLDNDLQEISNAKQRARKELVTLESDASKQENRLRELDRLIKGLEMRDPSNIRLQVKVLSNEWLDLSETELEAVPVKNELSGLLKEFHILKRRIQRIRGEMDTVRRRIDDTDIETILTLEKIVLDMEQASRTPQPEKEQISKIEADLQSLYAERNTLEQSRGNYR